MRLLPASRGARLAFWISLFALQALQASGTVTLSTSHDGGATSAASNIYTVPNGGGTFLLEGAVVVYTVSLSSSDTAVTNTALTVKVDGATTTTNCAVDATIPVTTSTLDCTFDATITSGQVTTGSLSALSIEVLDGSTSLVTGSLSRSGISLYKPGLSVNAAVNPQSATAKGDAVTYTVTIHNTGNVQLENVAITTDLTAASAAVSGLGTYACTSADINSGQSFTPGSTALPSAATMTCTATYTFSTVQTIEAGDLTAATTVTAQGKAAVTQTASTAAVTVTSSPALSVTAAAGACDSASPLPTNFAGSSTVTCPGALVISAAGSNVRISIASITLTSGAVLGTCTPTLAATPTAQNPLVLDPTSVNGPSITCDVTSPTLQQDDFEASLVAWNVTVGSATEMSSNAAVTGGVVQLQKALTQLRKYQLGIKRVPVNAEALTAVTTNTTQVNFKALFVNIGNTILKGVTVSDPGAFTCQKGATESSATTPYDGASNPTAGVSPGEVLVCVGTFMFDQNDLDTDQASKVFTPAAASASSPAATKDNTDLSTAGLGGYTEAATVSIGASPSVAVSVDTANCIKPSIIADGQTSATVTCPMTIHNTGQLTLTNVAAAIPAGSASYLSTDCGTSATFAPDAVKACTLTALADQDAYDAGSLQLDVDIAGSTGSRGDSGKTLVKTPFTGSISLAHTPGLTVGVVPSGAITRAGDKATYTITAANTGPVRLKELVLTIPDWATLTACTPAIPSSGPANWTVDPHKSLVCTAEYTFDQDVYEAGQLDFVASAKPLELGTSVSSAPASVSPVYTADWQFYQLGCTLPQAPGNIACTVGVANTGTVRLTGVQLSGPAGSCGQIAVLMPGDNITTCVLNKAVTQNDFDTQEANYAGTSFSLAVTAAGTSNVSSQPLTVPSTATTFAGLQLPVYRTMTVAAALSAASVATVGGAVDYTVTIQNTGNSRLRSVSISSQLSTLRTPQPATPLTYLCKVNPGDTGAAPPVAIDQGVTMTCTATYTFTTVQHIEAGDLTIASSVTAADYGSSVTATDKVVSVPSQPQFAATLNGQAACETAAPSTNFEGGTIACTDLITLSAAGSNVEVTIDSLTPADVTLSGAGCAAPVTLDPTNPASTSITCSITTRALTQNDFEAGQMAWTVTAHVTAKGGNTSVDGNKQVALTHTLVKEPKYQLGVKRVSLNGDDPAAAVTSADTNVKLQARLVNLGNLILKDLMMSIPSTTGMNCVTGTTAAGDAAATTAYTNQATAEVAPGHMVICTATHMFTQQDLDTDQAAKDFTPSVSTSTNSPVEDNSGLGGTSYTATASISIGAAPSLDLSVDTANCVVPSIIPENQADVIVTCPVKFHNSGHLTLTNVAAAIPADKVSYLSTDCGTTATLAPGANVTCVLTATAVQADYDAGTIALAVGVDNGLGHLGDAGKTTIAGTQSFAGSIGLNHTASMTLVATAAGAIAKAGDTVTYTITATNTGPVRLKELVLTIPNWATLTACTPAIPAAPVQWTVDPFKTLVCTAEYTFTQDVYEAGQLDFVASAKPLELNTAVGSAPASVTPTYTTSWTFQQLGQCSLPTSPGDITCSVGITNTGSVRIKNVQLTGPKGIEANCPEIALIAPTQVINTGCVLSKAVNQADFDAREATESTTLELVVTATGHTDVSAAPLTSPATATTFTGLQLPILRHMAVSDALSVASVSVTGDAVTHTVTIVNNGTVQLRSIDITTGLTTAGPTNVAGLTPYTCQLKLAGESTAQAPKLLKTANPVTTTDLPQGSTLTCVATYTWAAVAAIEAGDVTFNPSVTAESYPLSGTTQPEYLAPSVVTVPSTPQFSLTVDQAGCSAANPSPNFAGSTISCVNALTFSVSGSNVEVDINSITPTNVTLTGCVLSSMASSGSGTYTMDPTVTAKTVISCGITTRALLQSDFEAGQLAWTVSAAVVAKGGNTTIDGAKTVSFTHNLDKQPKHQLGIKRVAFNASDTDLTASIALPDTSVKMQVYLANTGNLILQGVAVSLSALADWTCNSGPVATADDAVSTAVSAAIELDPGYKVVCQGTFAFTQAQLDIDRSSVDFTPQLSTSTVPSSTLDGSGPGGSGYVGTATVQISAAPAMELTMSAANCVIPSILPSGQSSVAVTCPLQLGNTGALTLTALKAVTPVDKTYLSTNCATEVSLAPGDVRSCTLTATAGQDDFDVGALLLDVSVTANHLGYAGIVAIGGTHAYSQSITLNHSASMDVVATVSPASVSASGQSVAYTMTIGNTGAVRLKNITLATPAWATLGTCTPALPGPIDPHTSMSCAASYTFDPDKYEAGQLSFVAAAGSNQLPSPVTSAAAVVTPTFNSELTYTQGTCTLPQSPGFIECTLTVTNTGTVRLSGVTLTAPDNTCNLATVLAPSGPYTCVVKKAVNQGNFDDREAADSNPATELSLSVTATGTPPANTAALVVQPATASVFGALQLPIDRQMTVATSVSKTTVSQKGDSVTYTVVVNNTGNVQLRGVQITPTVTQARVQIPPTTLGSFSCHLGANTPVASLPTTVPHAEVLTCSVTYTWASVADVEAGDLTLESTVEATQVTSITGNSRTVTVPNTPQFSLSLSGSVCTTAQPAPDNFAGSKVTCVNAVTISAVGGNVRVDVANIAATGGATLKDCTVPNLATLDPTDTTVSSTTPPSILCSIESPVLLQTDYETGTLTWGISITGVAAKGGNATLNGDYPASYAKTLTQVRQYQLGITRMPLNATDPMDSILWADTPINAQVQLANMGNTILEGVVLSVPSVTNLACYTGASTSTDSEVLTAGTAVSAALDLYPRNKVVCSGSFNFDQVELDKNQAAKDFTPALQTTSTGFTPVAAGGIYSASISIPVASSPALLLTVTAVDCVIPSIIPSGANSTNVTCPMELHNSGQVTLTVVEAVIQGYLSTDCGTTAELAPGATKQCTLTAEAVQDNYDAGTLALAVTATAGHKGWATRTLSGTLSYSGAVGLNDTASMDVVVQAAGTASKAGDTVLYTITASNTGPVRLTNMQLTIPTWATLVNCTPSLPGPWVIAPYKALSCLASYTFSQDFYEEASLEFVAGVTARVKDNAVVSGSSAPATVPFTFDPKMQPYQGSCTLPTQAPGDIQCEVGVLNTGTVRLKQVQLQGPKNNCTTIAVLWPQQNVTTCVLLRAVTQNDFDAREALQDASTELDLVVEAVGTSNVTGHDLTITSPFTSFAGLQLEILRQMTATASLDRSSVNKTGQSVVHTVVVHNTGNVKLRDVDIATILSRGANTVTGLTAYTCTGGVQATLPSAMLVGTTMTCTADYTFGTVQDIEAGDLDFSTTVSAAAPVTPLSVVAQPATTTLNVISEPSISYTLDPATCDAPDTASGTTTCFNGLKVQNTGNVRASFTGVSSSTGAAAAGCSATDMAVDAVQTCTFTQPMSQDFLEAGNADITLVLEGISARGTAAALTPTRTLSITPAVTQQKQLTYTFERTDSLGTITTNDTTVTLQATLTNTGNVRLRQVTWSPDWVSAAAVFGTNCAVGPTADTLSPTASNPVAEVPVGQKLVCTGSFLVTQDVMEQGATKTLATPVSVKVTNALTALPLPGGAVTSFDIPVNINPKVTVSVADTGCTKPYRAGGLATCPAVVHNAGNMRIDTVVVAGDTNTCSKSLMLPDETLYCTMSRQLVQDEYEQGSFVLHATGTTGTAHGPVTLPQLPADVTSSAQPTLTQDPKLNVTLAVNASEVHKAGDTVLYTITAVNEGNVILYGIEATAATLAGLTTAVTCTPSGTLAVAATMVCTASYTFDQTSFEAGSKSLAAELSSLNLTSAVTSNTVITAPVEAPSVTVEILQGTCVVPTDAKPSGNPVTCDVKVVNTGNVGLSGGVVAVPATGTGCNAVPTLAPQASHTCSMTHIVEQADFDAWDEFATRVALGATVTANPTGVVATSAVTATTTNSVALVSAPALVVASSPAPLASPATVTTAGTAVTHTFTISNDGNVALRTLQVGGLDLATVSCVDSNNVAVANPVPTLAVSASLACTGVFNFTQDDIELGDALHKTRATAINVVPATSAAYTYTIDLAAVTVPNNPGLEALIHTSTCNMPGIESDNLVCTDGAEVHNTGNVRLENVAISGAINCSMAAGQLLSPGASFKCTITRTSVQDDFEAGLMNLAITGAATPKGTDTSLTNVQPQTAVDYTLTQIRAMEVKIVSDVPSVSAAGSNVHFTITAANKGNMILRTSHLTSPELGALTCTQDIDVNVRDTMTCTASASFDQTQLESGDETFHAWGESPTLLANNNVSATPQIIQTLEAPSLVVDVVGSSCTKPPRMPGDVVCLVQLTNTGNMRLNTITVDGDQNNCTFSLMWPADVVNCSMSRALTQAEFETGSASVNATAAHATPQGIKKAILDNTPADTATVVLLRQVPSLDITTVSDVGFVTNAGDVVTYTATAVNTGSLELHNLAFSIPTVTDLSCNHGTSVGTATTPLDSATVLHLDAVVVCTGTYNFTQDDIEKPPKVVATTATCDTSKGPQTFTSNSASVTAVNFPSMRVDIQTADCTIPQRAPEKLVCPVVITNLGNVRLANVSIIGQAPCKTPVIWPAGTYSCNTTLVSTQAQFEAAQMAFTFTTDASPLGANQTLAASDITDTDTVTLPTFRNLSIAVVAEPNTVMDAGSSVNYTYTISNPGNVMVRNIMISSTDIGPLRCNGSNPPVATLDVYQVVVCRGAFTFDQPTIELGDKVATATVTANSLTQAAVVPDVTVTVPNVPTLATAVPNITCSIPLAANNNLTCNLTIVNTGNVRITNITVGGDALSCGMASPTLLSPGANFTCVLRRLVVQDDFEAGSVDLLFPLNASALGQVSTLRTPLPGSVQNVKLPQLPGMQLVTTINPTFVTWPGDLVTYQVQIINSGNVHLKTTDLQTRTNSSATGMNTTFPVDCGNAGVLPVTVLVGTSITCTRTIEFTTPVIRAGNMTVRVTGSATNLPTPVAGVPRVVMTPTCDNRSAPIPSGSCLNVSKHCPNDIDYLCDKTDLNRRWFLCWGGVTEQTDTLGWCKYTPCKTCQVCLSWAATQTPQLFNMTNAGLVAAEVNTRCKAWGRTSATCQAAADAVGTSEVGNSGKRGGKLCSLMQECNNPAGFEPTCNLGNLTTVPGSSPAVPYVPKGNFSLCTAQGTNTGRIIPGGLVVAPNTPLPRGSCRTTPDCNSTDLMCTFTVTTRRCVCDEQTGMDNCEQLGTCGPTPCAICKSCFTAMSAVATAQQSVTNSTAVAQAFRTACVAGGRSLEACSVIALRVDGTYQGSFGKRPASLCAELAECPATLDPTCVLVPNTTLDKPAITVADLDTCTTSGIANGPVVPGFFSGNDTIPDGRCTAAQPCTGEGARCSYATGAKFCTCSYGTDTCVPMGDCYVTSCSTCQDCLTKTNTFVASQLQSRDPTAIAAAWKGFCGSKLARATAADCQLTEAAITASPYGNLGKRAASLCSWVKYCSSDMGADCKLNALVNNITYTAELAVCTVEGVAGGSRVPGVFLLPGYLPAGGCRADSDCLDSTGLQQDPNLMCNITTTIGDVCVCDQLSGTDTCAKYSGCVRTPCAVCSDCLSQMVPFTVTQLYNQNVTDIAVNLSAFCAATKAWTAAQCAAAVQAVLANKPSFGKRAGSLCQALGVCGAPGAVALNSGCLLKVSVPAYGDKPAATPPESTLDLCAVEGVSSGTDVPGTTRLLSLPTGTCDSDADCTASDPETMCSKTQQTPLCTCASGQETCRIIGGCVATPCKLCKRCLQDFSPFVRNTTAMALTGDALASAFRDFCAGTAKRSGDSCDGARLGVSSSFRGNAARRAAAICSLLSECSSKTVTGCSLTDGNIIGSLSLCTSEGISGGTPLPDFPINNITRPTGSCLVDRDCNMAGGEFCSRAVTTSSCACAAATGQDSCSLLGSCALTPCSRCQRCVSSTQSAVRTVLQSAGNARPDLMTAAGAFASMCTAFASSGGYATSVCSSIVSQYLPFGSSGYFGLRPGAVCSSLGQCLSIPADCRLSVTAGAPLLNITGGLDTCTAEGIVGGSALKDVVAVADPPGLCLNDTLCAKDNKQCDTMNTTQVLRCTNGLDTSSTYGRCVAKPPPPPTVSPCERCSRCLNAAQPLVAAAVAANTSTAAFLSNDFYTWCSGRGYALSSCRTVQAAISSSLKGNLARRAGALCQRVGECADSLAADTTCLLSVSANSSSAVAGRLDVCAVQGVTGGQQVPGTGASSSTTTCVLDSDCNGGQLCSSSITLSVCRCMGGLDGCDDYSTCQPKPTPAPPAPPPVVLSPCDGCKQCISNMQRFVAQSLTSSDPAALASSFVSQCTSSFMPPGSVFSCQAIGSSIAFSIGGNLAKRAGALCAYMGNCSVLAQSSSAALAACSISLPGTSVANGPLDLCTAEGVAQGTMMPGIKKASTSLDPGTCASDKDCGNGTPICSMANPSTRCTCANGSDACIPIGTCVDFCSTKAAAIAQANALVMDCDPTVASVQCPAGLECKASTACKKLACDGSGVQTRQCFGLCMPAERNLVAAQLSDDGKSIKVALNAAAAPGSFACLSAFNMVSTHIGADAWCTVANRELTIQLGTRPTLVPEQDSLVLLTGQTVLYDVLDPTAHFTGSRVVAMCSNCQPPLASVFGPQLVPEPCDASKAADIIFDASFSKDASGRALVSYQWAQVGSNDVILAGDVSAANTAQGGAGSPRLIIPAGDLINIANQDYTLSVTVTNYLGASATASITFTKVPSGQAPVVTIAGGTQQTFKLAEGVKLSAQLLATSVCAGKKVEYLWESEDGWSAVPDGYKRKDLVIRAPLSGVLAGQTKRVKLTAAFRDSPNNGASVTVDLTAVGSPLQVSLRGPSGNIRGDRSIVLNASRFFDPDDQSNSSPLTVAWDCTREDYPVPCFAGTDYGTQSGLVWTLPASLLTPSMEHTFKVTVLKDARSTSASLALTPLPVASKVPTGRLVRQCSGSSCSKRHNADTPLTLTLAPDAGAVAAAITWQSDQLAGMDLGKAADLSIPVSKLPATGSLVVNALLTLPTGEVGSTQLTVPLNGKPSCSLAQCLVVTAVSDTFPDTKYTLEATGFIDDQDLRYEFGKVSAEGRREVMSSGRTPTATLTGLSLTTAGVYVCAVDTDGAKVCEEATVTVKQPSADFKVTDVLTSFDVGQLTGAGDISVMAAGAQALSSLSSFVQSSGSSGVSGAATAAGAKQVQTAIAAKAGVMINSLASSASSLMDDPQSMGQVVAAVSTLSKAAAQLSSDVMSTMLSVVDTSIICTKVNKQQLTADEATRLFAIVAAGSGIKATTPASATSAGSRRHLLSEQGSPAAQLQQGQSLPALCKPGAPCSNTSSSAASGEDTFWEGSNDSRYQLFGPQSRTLLDTAAYVPPAFLASAQTIADLLSASASPGSAFVSGGDNGLYVSVANQLGRSYASGAGVAVGPVSQGTGAPADATSARNAVVSFSKPLTSSCVAEDGTAQTNTSCSDVPVPVTLTLLSDPSPLLSSSATRAAGAAALPAGFTVVSGALLLQVSGSSTGALPCDSCTARLTVPVTDTATDSYSYSCAQVVNGQLYLNAAVASAGTASSTASGAVVQCTVNQAGSYVVGRVLRPDAAAPAQGVGTVDPNAAAADSQRGAPSTSAIIGGVVGGVVGAVLLAGAVTMFVIKRRRDQQGLQPHLPDTDPRYRPNKLQQEYEGQQEGDLDPVVALPPAYDDEGDEVMMSAMQWAKLHGNSPRPSKEGARQGEHGPHGSGDGQRPPSHLGGGRQHTSEGARPPSHHHRAGSGEEAAGERGRASGEGARPGTHQGLDRVAEDAVARVWTSGSGQRPPSNYSPRAPSGAAEGEGSSPRRSRVSASAQGGGEGGSSPRAHHSNEGHRPATESLPHRPQGMDGLILGAQGTRPATVQVPAAASPTGGRHGGRVGGSLDLGAAAAAGQESPGHYGRASMDSRLGQGAHRGSRVGQEVVVVEEVTDGDLATPAPGQHQHQHQQHAEGGREPARLSHEGYPRPSHDGARKAWDE